MEFRSLSKAYNMPGWRVGFAAGMDSAGFAEKLLEDAHVLAIPGHGFGPGGEGCVRLTVCAGTEPIRDAIRRITAVHW
ncbi:aminotransferase class I/II-fold pyridoxal phosphate-dependent enzyme [Streptomyces sioyaensis]|uniref:aminotransferase class I/II-fold pyridoxal phosphate-dependent enzyme n=1 Tax=Streptomyces sioyaensis TaxID=67364 RepID=UPI0033C3385E